MPDQPLLEVSKLVAGYGAATVLHEISFEMGIEAVAIVGRNGMGKTTLCNTIVGLVKASSGSIKLAGQESIGDKIHTITSGRIGYVPQGRRLFQSLTVHEHLAMLARDARGLRWTPDAVLELFPRLKERTNVRGTALSGGEQQMLAIGRALLMNAPLIIMDEPSEGLAPTIVDNLIDVSRALVEEGHAVLLVEQNLRVATSIAPRQLVMVSGRIEAELTAEELENDHEAQRRYLGVDTLEEA